MHEIGYVQGDGEFFTNFFPQQNTFPSPIHYFDACFFFVTLVSLKRNKRLCVLPKLLISILTKSSFTLIEWKVDRFLLDYHIAIIDKRNKTLPHQGNCR